MRRLLLIVTSFVVWLAVLAAVILVLCFTPSPIEPTELLTR